MSGAPEREYVLARRVLLDALDALGGHRDACVLVGAQAVYFHTGPSDIAVPEHTTDADLAIDPRILEASPLLGPTLIAAGFRASGRPGTWLGNEDVEVDLMVPATLGGGGRRGARIPPHDNNAARKAKGLEAAIEDWATQRVASLEPDRDHRSHVIRVAGPAALLVLPASQNRRETAKRATSAARPASPPCPWRALRPRAVETNPHQSSPLPSSA